MSTKVCKKCHVEKPIEQFSINRQAKDGRINSCKPCEVKRVAEWTAANPEKVKAWANRNRSRNLRAAIPESAAQMCTKCRIEKRLGEFHANPRNKLNVRKICKACTAEHMEKRYIESPEKHRAKSAKWRKENPERYRAYMDIYQKNNREERNEYRRQFRLKNIEREKEKDRRYVINNRPKVRAKNARRRASETQATPLWLTAIQKAQLEEFYELAAAKQTQTGIEQHVDHIVPLRGNGVCGLHVPWNLQILTESENCSKYNKIVEVRS